MKIIERLISGALLLVLISGCASPVANTLAVATKEVASRPYTINGQRYYPQASSKGYREQGIASWYGPKFNGRPTASGSKFDMYGLTAAHRTLPFGTRLKVTNLDNGRLVEVLVNDRGPFVKGRIIDLALGAAKRIGLIQSGTAAVLLEAIGSGAIGGSVRAQVASPLPVSYTIQLASFSTAAKAVAYIATWQPKLTGRYLFVSGASCPGEARYRVRVGHFGRKEAAQKVLEQLAGSGLYQLLVVRE